MRDTKLCRFCNQPIVVMCQQGRGYCCQNHEDADNRAGIVPMAIAGWEVPPSAS